MKFIMTHWVFVASLLIFVVTFGLIITEAIPGVIAAMSGGLLMIMIRILKHFLLLKVLLS